MPAQTLGHFFQTKIKTISSKYDLSGTLTASCPKAAGRQREREFYHSAAEGTGSGLVGTWQLLVVIRLCSECVQRHRALVAAERATTQRLPVAS